MIEKIEIPQRVPFDGENATIEGLSRVNLFFGPNGSGKTTISRLIRDETSGLDSGYISWGNDNQVTTYVYNRDFVRSNFESDKNVPGVFTIGEDSIEAQNTVRSLTDRIEKEREKLHHCEANLSETEKRQEELTGQIRDACWEVKGGLPELFKHALKGAMQKESFRERCLRYLPKIQRGQKIPSVEELEKRAKVIFDESTSAVEALPAIDFHRLQSLESEPVLAKNIIGKSDVPIAELIKQLGNSDWVLAGRKYVGTGNVCPFCQKPTLDNNFKAQLERFFDESYTKDMSQLENVNKAYRAESASVVQSLEGLLGPYEHFVEIQQLKTQISELRRKTDRNAGLIAEKARKPSLPIKLMSTRSECQAIASLLAEAADRIAEHNAMIKDRAAQQKELREDIWRYIAEQVAPRIKGYQDQEDKLSKKGRGLKESVDAEKSRIDDLVNELNAAESTVTNVKDTAETINGILTRFGFNSFRLCVADDGRTYRIERGNGEPAAETLSEGESSFLTFLYFYQLMNGSQRKTGVSDKRVVVIDDPISSMDADVLFVVSALVRKLASDARNGDGAVEQLFVLTHNLTFHREVSYVREGEGDAKTSYYVLHKGADCTTIEKCDSNPITSTYELLWRNLYAKDCSPLTAQNVSRRIVETFFNLVGGMKIDNVIASMKPPEREIARSFWSWANAGSHVTVDDETYFDTRANVESYRRVLKAIFEGAGYKEHYDHMIKVSTGKR